jgi:hypothetical protein
VGSRGLVSFGTAGGLALGLAPGTLVLADAVVFRDGSRLAVDVDWHERLYARLSGTMPLVTDAIAAADAPLLTPEAKAACRRATGAVAVDMESGEVALAADPSPSHYRRSLPLPPRGDGRGEGAALPFIVMRAIADPAERTVPAWVMRAVSADGRTAILPVLSHLTRRPGQLPALVRLATDARAAMRSLRRVAALVGPLFAFDR